MEKDSVLQQAANNVMAIMCESMEWMNAVADECDGIFATLIKKKARPKKSRPLLTYEKHQAQI